MKTKIETITKEKAREYLRFNKKNRPLKSAAVSEYANEMRAGRWALTHQGIAFDDEGALMDGQNRLLAIMEAGMPVQMMVTRGIPRQLNGNCLCSQDVMDTGRKRTAADQLSLMHGVANANLTASVARYVAKLVGGEGLIAGSFNVAHCMGVLNVYGDEIAQMIAAASGVKHLRRAPIIAAMAFCAAVVPMGEIIHKLVTGEGMQKGDPILTLRNHLFKVGAAKGRKPAELVMEWVTNSVYNSTQANSVVLVKRGRIGTDYFRSRQKQNIEKVRTALIAKS
jgi:hypothetical protein